MSMTPMKPLIVLRDAPRPVSLLSLLAASSCASVSRPVVLAGPEAMLPTQASAAEAPSGEHFARAPRRAANDDGTGSDAEALAKKLANPIAALISVPFQLNYDDDIGPGDGERWTLNVQPVVPISLNAPSRSEACVTSMK